MELLTIEVAKANLNLNEMFPEAYDFEWTEHEKHLEVKALHHDLRRIATRYVCRIKVSFI